MPRLFGVFFVCSLCLSCQSHIDIRVDGAGVVRSGELVCVDRCRLAAVGPATLVAEAANGHRFDRWSGSCSGADAGCLVAGGGAVTAHFVPDDSPILTNLSITLVGSGRVMSDTGALECNQPQCDLRVSMGTVITLRATPDIGWGFDGFLGDCVDDPCVVSPPARLTAVFSRRRKISLSFEGTGTGVATFSDGQRCTTDCERYVGNDSVTISGEGADDYSSFDGFSGDCSGSLCELPPGTGDQLVLVGFRSVLEWSRSFVVQGMVGPPGFPAAALSVDDGGIVLSRTFYRASIDLDGVRVQPGVGLQWSSTIVALDWDGGIAWYESLNGTDGGVGAANQINGIARASDGAVIAVGACRGHVGGASLSYCSESSTVERSLRIRLARGAPPLITVVPDTADLSEDRVVVVAGQTVFAGTQRYVGNDPVVNVRLSRLDSQTLENSESRDYSSFYLGTVRGANPCIATGGEGGLLCSLDSLGRVAPTECLVDGGTGPIAGDTVVAAFTSIDLTCSPQAKASAVAVTNRATYPGGLSLSMSAAGAPLLLVGSSRGAVDFGAAGNVTTDAVWLAELADSSEFSRMVWWPTVLSSSEGQEPIGVLQGSHGPVVLGAIDGTPPVFDRRPSGPGVYLLFLREDWTASSRFWLLETGQGQPGDTVARFQQHNGRLVVSVLGAGVRFGGKPLAPDNALRLHVLVLRE